MYCHGDYLCGIMRDLPAVRSQMRQNPEKYEEGIGMPPEGYRRLLMPVPRFNEIYTCRSLNCMPFGHEIK